jgi:hypothetical protein
MFEDGRTVPGENAQADVIDILPFLAWRCTLLAPDLSIHIDEINQRCTGPQLHKPKFRHFALDLRAQHILIEADHRCHVLHAEDDMVDGG